MADLTSLYKQRAALDAEIRATREAAAKAGEIIVIDGKEYDSTIDFEGSLPSPAITDYIPTYRKDDNGDITDAGEITYGDLVDDFAQEATAKVQEAVNAGNTAVQNIENAETAALQAIGQTDDAGARKAALDAISSAKTAALTAIGQTDSEGARKAALDAISAARAAALSAIGESNTAGARGEAIAAINELYDQIEAAIEQADTAIDQKVETATNAASAAATSASNASSSETNAASSASAAATSATNAASSESNAETYKNQAQSAKTDAESAKTAAESAKTAAETARTGAETAEDNAESSASAASGSATAAAGSAVNAATSETNAANSEALAEKWAENPEDEPVEGTGDNAKFSAKHWASKAQANSNVPMATDTTAGKVYISNTAEISEGEANLTNKTVSKQALNDALEELRSDLKQTLPSPEVEYTKAATGDYGTFDLKTNYSSAFGNVKVVMTPSASDPSASDTEITVAGTTVSANDSWQITAIQTDPDAMYSDSLTAVIEVADLKCRAPLFSYNQDTYTFTLTAQTEGSVIRYTTNGSEPDENSTIYSSPVTVSESKTVKAKAFKAGILASDTTTGDAIVAKIICVSFPVNGNTGTRITPETDPLGLVTETITVEPVPEIPGTQSGSSLFDQYDPWQKRRCNFENGAFKRWDDDPSFSTTEYDTMVKYPENTYIKLAFSSDGNTEYRYFSTRPFEGFEKAPWAGKYGAAYETSNSNESKSGKTVQVNQSITTMRTNARAKGDGWNQLDAVMHAADQWLFMVEYASRDCQAKIGQGISGVSSKHNTGETDVLEYHTGRCAGTDAACAVRYRWSENLWGNVYEWCDGVRTAEGASYRIMITDDPDLYDQSVIQMDSPGWTMINSGGTAINGNYIAKFSHNESAPWCSFIPESVANASESQNAAPDYTYCTSNPNYFLSVSGSWDDGPRCGLWYFNLDYSASSTYSFIGGRLTYREPSAA